MLAYNQAPSFNWDAAGMTDEEMSTFIKDLGKLGCRGAHHSCSVTPPKFVQGKISQET